jgi:hypothetical protein
MQLQPFRIGEAEWRGGNYKFMEWLKDLSDKLILWFLRTTAGFGKELTTDGRREQQRWREQRLRNLQGLRSVPNSASAPKTNSFWFFSPL